MYKTNHSNSVNIRFFIIKQIKQSHIQGSNQGSLKKKNLFLYIFFGWQKYILEVTMSPGLQKIDGLQVMNPIALSL